MADTILAVAASVALAASAGATVPVAVDLGTLGGPYSRGNALNNGGQVVGVSRLPDAPRRTGPDHAFSWTQLGGMIDLGTLGGSLSEAIAVNDGGQVAGEIYSADGSYRSFLWTRQEGMIDLGTLGRFARPVAMNARGQIVGISASHAFSWTQEGGMIDLGTLGGWGSEPSAINGVGQVVGTSWVAGNGSWHAWSWTAQDGMIDLGTLAGSLPQTHYNFCSWGVAVNDDGQMVGGSITGSGDTHAFLWTPDGGMVDLGTLGGRFSWPWAVNGRGQIVGVSSAGEDGWFHPVLWTREGGMIDLGSLGGPEGQAFAVNGSGQVVGYSFVADGSRHAFSWTPESGIIDLGTLGGSYSEATAVNESGQVVGWASLADGSVHAVLWKTNPMAELESLSAAVQDMGLPFGIARSLTMKMGAASAALAERNTVAACHVLVSLLNEANAQRENALTWKQADFVAASGLDVRTMLQCP